MIIYKVPEIGHDAYIVGVKPKKAFTLHILMWKKFSNSQSKRVTSCVNNLREAFPFLPIGNLFPEKSSELTSLLFSLSISFDYTVEFL